MSEQQTDAGELGSVKRFFTTDAGVNLLIKPVPPLLIAKVQQAAAKTADDKYPGAPPTYEIVDGGGGVELKEHDDESVSTDEERAQLAKWRDTLKQRSAFTNDRFMKFLLMRGVAIDLPESDQWARDQEAFDIVIPSDPTERRLHYIQTELIGVIGDLSGLAVEILAASGVDQEAIKAARASFRGNVRDGSQDSGSPGQSDGSLPVEGSGPAVADIEPVYRAGSSQELGAYAVAMG